MTPPEGRPLGPGCLWTLVVAGLLWATGFGIWAWFDARAPLP